MRITLFNSKTGTTLIEVMIALIIIAIVIMGGGMFFFYGRVQIVREAHRRAATLVASGKLEELKATNYSDIIVGSTTKEVDVDNLSKDSATPPTMITLVEDVADGGNPEAYKKVTVTVNWPDGTTNSMSVTTLIAPQ